jgi:hypothetical protein
MHPEPLSTIVLAIWDEYVDAVEQADESIAVVGVTDDGSINTCKEFKRHQDAGRMENIRLAIPTTGRPETDSRQITP